MKLPDRIDKIQDRNFLFFCTVLIITGTIFIAGCISQEQSQSAGSTAVRTPLTITDIGKISENPRQYNGTSVSIRGKITLECASGCWFILKDETGTIYVILSQDNFAIPQLQGQTVTAQGTVLVTNGDTSILANRVITDSRTYP